MVRSTLFAQLYHEQVDPLTELLSSPDGSIPVAISQSGDGLIFAPLDHLLWTEETEEVATGLARLMDEHGGSDEHLRWIEGDVADLALASLKSQGWVESSDAFDQLEAKIND